MMEVVVISLEIMIESRQKYLVVFQLKTIEFLVDPRKACLVYLKLVRLVCLLLSYVSAFQN